MRITFALLTLMIVSTTVLTWCAVATAADDATQSKSPQDLARESFHAASAAFEKGDFLEAAKQFEEAHRLAPHPSAQFNAAVSWDRAGNRARAASAYDSALTDTGLDASQTEEARARLAVLRKVLGYIRVDEPIGEIVSVGHLDEVAIPVRLYVTPGTYRIRPAGASQLLAAEVSVGAGQVTTVRLKRRPKAATSPGAEPEPPMPPASPSDSSDFQQTTGWVLVGGAVLATGVAAFLGVRALGERDAYNESGFTDAKARKQAKDLRLGTNIAWATSGVLGVAGTVLLLTSPTFEF